MLKSAFVGGLFAVAFIAQPAFAMDEKYTCDEASMMKMESDMNTMAPAPTKEQKEMAMKEFAAAKEAMGANKTDDCQIHLDKIMADMKKS
jgi:hypothetical protein